MSEEQTSKLKPFLYYLTYSLYALIGVWFLYKSISPYFSDSSKVVSTAITDQLKKIYFYMEIFKSIILFIPGLIILIKSIKALKKKDKTFSTSKQTLQEQTSKPKNILGHLCTISGYLIHIAFIILSALFFIWSALYDITITTITTVICFCISVNALKNKNISLYHIIINILIILSTVLIFVIDICACILPREREMLNITLILIALTIAINYLIKKSKNIISTFRIIIYRTLIGILLIISTYLVADFIRLANTDRRPTYDDIEVYDSFDTQNTKTSDVISTSSHSYPSDN